MSDALLRGMLDVSRIALRAPQATPAVLGLRSAASRSFSYHVPRRIPQRSHSIHTVRASSDVGTPPASLHSAVAETPIPALKAWRHYQSQLPGAGKHRLPPHPAFQTSSHCTARRLSPPRTLLEPRNHNILRSKILSDPFIRKFHHTPASEDQRDRQEKSSIEGQDANARQQAQPETAPQTASKSNPNSNSKSETDHGQSQSQSNSTHENFYDRLHMPQFHRPTKEELLAAATGFWSRLKVRFKWLTIKSVRPFNMDEIVGFISWIALGHVLWIVIGTTTFVSLAILAINTVFAQETLARWVGNYLTQSSGLQVVFESAIVPKWGDGVITFKNVFVSRRPGQPKRNRVTKGSPEAAALAKQAEEPIPAEEQNYTQFDITIGEVNVTLSFSKWWNSKGPLQNVEVKHVRGVVDRTHVFWTGEQIDPKSYRREHTPGDFEIEAFKIEDLLVTVLQPQGFRPFPVSIYTAELPRLRKQYLFYDFLCATSMTGEFDRSLFTIHPRQTHSFTGTPLTSSASNEPWKKQSRIRIDALNIDHLNRGVVGPLSWITEGNVDIVADMLIPSDGDESVIKVMTDFYERMEETLTSRKHLEPSSRALSSAPTEAVKRDEDNKYLLLDLRIHLNDVRASVPIFTSDLSYINNALIRPIVAYINSRRTFIPLTCRVVKRLSDFDGSWTVFDSGLMDDLSAEVYDAFARDVTDEQARLRRFKKVGLWSLQVAAQAIFLGMAGNMA